MSSQPASRTRRAGFSLAELMVGLSLGLLTLLMLSQAYLAFRFQHRGTDSDMAAQTSAMNALYAIERDLLQAGQGMGERRLLGCSARRDSGAAMLLAPAQIIAGTDGGPDKLQLLLGDSRAAPTRLSAALAAGAAVLAVDTTLGMRAGDVLALQQDGRPCALLRVAGIDSLLQASRMAEDGKPPQASADAIVAAGYQSGAMAYDLGRLASVSYAISGTSLQRTSIAFPGTVAVTQNIASDIVSLRLQYGFDTRPGAPARLEVDRWSTAMLDADNSGTAGDRGDWQRMAGIRLALVARSPLRQAAGAGGACATTVSGGANAPAWHTMQADGTPALTAISLAHVADWQCYRYRVAELAVPLRNVMRGLP